jgi:pheromone shutdown protein TraB
MSTQRASGTQSCPYCGQNLLDERAVQCLEQSMAVLEQRLEKARELAAELAAAHRDGISRIEDDPELDQKQAAAERAEHEKERDKVQLNLRQF